MLSVQNSRYKLNLFFSNYNMQAFILIDKFSIIYIHIKKTLVCILEIRGYHFYIIDSLVSTLN